VQLIIILNFKNMGFVKKFKANVGKVYGQLPKPLQETGQVVADYITLGVAGQALESSVDVANRQKQADKAMRDKAAQAMALEGQLAQAQQQAILSQEDLKRMEEEKKKQTTFAGSSLQNIIERRKLGV